MAVFCTVKRQMQNLATAVFKAFTPPHSYTSDCPKHQQSGTEDSLACIVPFITMIRSWLHTEKKKKNQKQELKYQRQLFSLFYWGTVHWFHTTVPHFLKIINTNQSWQWKLPSYLLFSPSMFWTTVFATNISTVVSTFTDFYVVEAVQSDLVSPAFLWS